MDDIEMKPKGGNGASQTAAGLSRTAVFAIVGAVCVSLAVGLGVGLGVGLNNIEYVYITSTTKQPSSSSEAPPTAAEPTTPDLTTTTALPTGPPAGGGPWENYRLPTYIIPSHYRLFLHPNMTTDTYNGTIVMTFNITEKTKYVIVHAHASLQILGVVLVNETGVSIDIVTEFRYPVYEFYVVGTADELEPGEYKLAMIFSNSLVDAIVGIYKSTYTTSDGTVKGIVGSDMEPTDTRRAYPCFDEPAMKIRYTTSIAHETSHTALSNMPVDGEPMDKGNGISETHFLESVPMSTYLGCFVVCEFGFINETSARGIPLRVYAQKDQIDKGQADYALKVMKVIFDEFEELFQVNYSLPKCDQIAIPNFGTGAMENWGLITYRETNLLWDPVESSNYNKQRVVAVVAHELVHQWFGNIVTMKWWDNLWLNEGFASYLEYYGVQAAEPDWTYKDHAVIDDVQPVMLADSSLASHPIVVNVSTPSQITEVFDSITYSKGASVIRMMNFILGDDLFFGALANYLNNRKFSNADEQDLWSDMQEYIDAEGAGFNIKEIMDPFVNQMGLPVITIEDLSTAPVTAKQEHMLADATPDFDLRPASKYNYTWQVRIDYYTSDDANVQEFWLNRTDANVDLEVTGNPSWIKVNVNETGYYRVNYPSETWDRIAEQLENDSMVFSELDRSNIIDDGLNLAPAGRLSYTGALNLTTYLDEEESYFVWSAFADGSSYIRQMLASTDSYPNFQTYYLSKVKPIADKLGWNGSIGTHEEKRNRVTVLGLALRYDDQDALNNATSLFAVWKSEEYVHPDVRQLVYRYGIVGGTTSDWEYMFEKYLTETIATEKSNLLRGITSTEDVALIDRLLEYSKNDSIIKEQDFFTCITYISYSVNGNKMAWSWVQLNWDYLVERFGTDSRSLGRLVPSIVDSYNTELQLWEVESLFEKYPEAGAGARNRENALLQIKLNIAWMAANEVSISDWLADRV